MGVAKKKNAKEIEDGYVEIYIKILWFLQEIRGKIY